MHTGPPQEKSVPGGAKARPWGGDSLAAASGTLGRGRQPLLPKAGKAGSPSPPSSADGVTPAVPTLGRLLQAATSSLPRCRTGKERRSLCQGSAWPRSVDPLEGRACAATSHGGGDTLQASCLFREAADRAWWGGGNLPASAPTVAAFISMAAFLKWGGGQLWLSSALGQPCLSLSAQPDGRGGGRKKRAGLAASPSRHQGLRGQMEPSWTGGSLRFPRPPNGHWREGRGGRGFSPAPWAK